MPERSILGPALFTMFMNDLANGIKYTTYQHLWFRHSVPETEADKLEELINNDLAVTRSTYLDPNSARETRFGSGTQVKPCRLGLRIGWVTFREYRREGHL